MPSLGADMDFGTVVEWRVKQGDVVHRGDIVAVVDTEKSDIDVEVFEDGVVEEVLVPEGKQVPVGTPLLRIGSSRPTEPTPPKPTPPPPPAPPTPPTPARGFVRASPRARAAAAAAGVDLAAVAGTGPLGAVTTADVASCRAEPDIPGRARQEAAAPDRMRAAIASLMARSKREIPHYYLATTVDMTAAMAWLHARNADRPVDQRVLPVALLLKATARAARATAGINGFWKDGGFVPAPAVHLGVAVSLRGGGLLAPAIHDADTLSVQDLMAALVDLVRRARTGGLRGSEVSDPTITVTSLGDMGVEEVFGVIYPPQVAIVGFGRVHEEPRAVDGGVECRPVVRATLSADHRASDGHQGARFLAALDDLLQRPEDL